jgi:hypothetical protein
MLIYFSHDRKREGPALPVSGTAWLKWGRLDGAFQDSQIIGRGTSAS